MSDYRLDKNIQGLVLDLGNSVRLEEAAWSKTTAFSWCIDDSSPEKPVLLLTSSSKEEDIIAPAPTASELLESLPSNYMGLYIRLNKWGEKPTQAGYSVSYCLEDGSADFLTEDKHLGIALANMWIWINSEEPPQVEKQ